MPLRGGHAGDGVLNPEGGACVYVGAGKVLCGADRPLAFNALLLFAKFKARF